MDGERIELQIDLAGKIHQHSFFSSMIWHRQARSCPLALPRAASPSRTAPHAGSSAPAVWYREAKARRQLGGQGSVDILGGDSELSARPAKL